MDESQSTKYRLLVYGLDDRLVLALPLSDDQACALGAALHLDGLDGIGLLGEHAVPHVHFEVCDV